MKTRYILTYHNEPITDIILSAKCVVVTTDEDCEPIMFIGKDSVVKMCLSLSTLLNDYDFGWERIYV